MRFVKNAWLLDLLHRYSFLGFAVIVFAGCTTVGTGTRTIIRARCVDDAVTCDQLTKDFPHLLVKADSPDGDLVVVIGPNGTREVASSGDKTLKAFREYRVAEYGVAPFQPASLAVNIHDRSAAAALLPIDITTTVVNTLSTYIAANAKQPFGTPIALQQFLMARLRNIPDLALVAVPHDRLQCGIQSYYYYPQISLDFGSVFHSPSILDRLDYLAVRVKLHADSCDGTDPEPRIIDYTPKAADFADYTRGQLTTAAQLQAQLAYVPTKTVASITGETPDTTTTTKSATIGPASGPQIGATVSDSYVAQLTDAIDRRTSGVFDSGRTFYADFRGIRNVRIGGTYNFDLMLEVPTYLARDPCSKDNPQRCRVTFSECSSASVTPGPYFSWPIAEHVSADIALIGVLRHVYHRGHIGAFNKLPEAENDDVYEEVALRTLKDVPLWNFAGEPATTVVSAKQGCTVAVTTNRDDGAFVVTGKDGTVAGRGSGREGAISFSADASGVCQGALTFIPVVITTGADGAPRLLVPSAKATTGTSAQPDASGLAVLPFDFKKGDPFSVVVAYAPPHGK